MLRLTSTDQAGTRWILDLDDIPGIEQIMSVKEVRDVSATRAPLTLTISLPGTANNNLFFESIYNVNVSTQTFNPALKLLAHLSDGGVELLNGTMQLRIVKIQPESNVSYEVVLVGVLMDFAKTLGEKLLTANPVSSDDLQFPEIEEAAHGIWTTSQAIDTWVGNASTQTIMFPLVEYGYGWDIGSITNVGNPPTNPLRINETVFPAIYVRRIWDKIFHNAGFSYEFTDLDIDNFNKLIILNPHISRSNELEQIVNLQKGITSDIASTSTPVVVDFDIEHSDPDGCWSTDTFTAPDYGYYTFRINLEISFNSPSYHSKGDCVMLINGNIYEFDGKPFATSPSVFPDKARLQAERTIWMKPGMTMKLGVRYLDTPTAGYDAGVVGLSGGNYMSIHTAKRSVLSSNVLPQGVKQIDFIKSIMNMFNLVVDKYDVYHKRIVFTTRDFWLSQGIEKDWSEKLDQDSDYIISVLSDEASRIYRFSHEFDRDFFNKNYKAETGSVLGEAIVEIPNDFNKDTKEIKTLFGGTGLIQIPKTKIRVPCAYDFDGQAYKSVDTLPKIMVHDGTETVVTDWGTAIDFDGNIVNTYPFVSMFFDHTDPDSESIHFGDSINEHLNGVLNTNGLFEYWRNEIEDITSPDARFLACRMWLTESDIESLKFNDKIHLQVENNPSWWRVQKVVYRPGANTLSDVELIKIDELSNRPAAALRQSNKKRKPDDPIIWIDITPGDPLPLIPIVAGDLDGKPGDNPLGQAANYVDGSFNYVYGKGNYFDGTTQFNSVYGNFNVIKSTAADGACYNNTIFGSDNEIDESSSITINGNGCVVGPGCLNVTITGNNISVPGGTTNVTIIGDGINVPTAPHGVLATNIVTADDNVTIISPNAAATFVDGANTNSFAVGEDAVPIDNGFVFGTNTKIIVPILPNLTGTERDSIVAPYDGMILFNTSTNKVQVWIATDWIDLN